MLRSGAVKTKQNRRTDKDALGSTVLFYVLGKLICKVRFKQWSEKGTQMLGEELFRQGQEQVQRL